MIFNFALDWSHLEAFKTETQQSFASMVKSESLWGEVWDSISIFKKFPTGDSEICPELRTTDISSD